MVAINRLLGALLCMLVLAGILLTLSRSAAPAYLGTAESVAAPAIAVVPADEHLDQAPGARTKSCLSTALPITHPVSSAPCSQRPLSSSKTASRKGAPPAVWDGDPRQFLLETNTALRRKHLTRANRAELVSARP